MENIVQTPRDYEIKDGTFQNYPRNNEFTNLSKGHYYSKDHIK